MTGFGGATWLHVDLEALRRNFREVSRLAGARRVICAVKANGYGFGAVAVMREFEACGAYGVWAGNPEEAIAAREAGIGGRIIMFGGYLPEEIGELVSRDLIPTIHDRSGLTAARQVAEQRGIPTPVYLKVDCGLRRLGVPVSQAADFAREIGHDRRLHLEGIYTHLPFASDDGCAWAQQRSAAFGELVTELEGGSVAPDVTQLWGSSGLLAGLPDASNAVCVGQLLYGLSPLAGDGAPSAEVTTVIKSLTSRLIQVCDHPDGPSAASANSYGMGAAARTGVIPLGTSDGVRGGSHGRPMQVLVGGRPAPVLGVTLEHMVLDLDRVPRAEPGDEVVLIGGSDDRGVTLTDWANWFGCSQSEVAVSFLGRLPHRYD